MLLYVRDGMWQSCVCECVWSYCLLSLCVCVKLLYVRDGMWQSCVCVSVCEVIVLCERGGGGRRRGGEATRDTESKTRTPHKVVGNYDRRKFRSQTSDNMDRWKAEQGRGREKRTIRREKIREEKEGKSRNTVFFQWFGVPEGRKVGSLKRRVRSQLARWEMKNCTPLWREAHFEVKMYKTPQRRTTLGSCDVEKVHAVVARSTFRSQNVQNITGSEHFGKLRCRKGARCCGAKHISKSKCTKHHMFAPLLEVQMSFRVAGARDCAPCPKWAKREGFVAFPKTMAGVGHLKRICKDFSVAGAVQKTWSWEMLGGQGADFLRGVAFWSIRSVGLLRWFCATGAALRMTWHQFFVAGAVL